MSGKHSANTIEQIQKESSEVTDESLACTERMAKLSIETVEIGNKTLGELNLQREKLNDIEKKMEDIKTNVTKAERDLTKMEKCCGCFSLPWGRNKLKFNDKKSKHAFDSEIVTSNTSGNMISVSINTPMLIDERYITRITNDKREDKMEENMIVVDNMIKDMNHQAHEMSCELDKQNEIINRISLKIDHNNTRINVANVRTIQLM
jgi:synaptosomal-associated protein 25